MTPAASEGRADDVAALALLSRLKDDPAARDELVEIYQPLVAYFARRFSGRGEPHEDLVQVANIGLLAAIGRFDPERGVPFSTYASATIVGELKRHFRDKGWTIRVPRPVQELAQRLNRVLPTLHQELGRSPTYAELAAALDVEQEDVVEAFDARQAYSPASLDAPTGVEGTTLADAVGGADPSMELVDRWAAIAPAVKDLPARERQVLYLRFFRGLTQSEIAEEIGVSQMHVSRILTQTLRTLREAATDPDEVLPDP